MEKLIITEKMEKEVNKFWADRKDEDAYEVVDNFLHITPAFAEWIADDEIAFIAELDDDNDDVAPEWSDGYLNTLGMSLADF